jgi:hypothetical protein
MSKFNQTFSAALVLVCASSAVFCSLPLSSLGRHAETNHALHRHCGNDQNHYSPSDSNRFFLFDPKTCWGLICESIDPLLPVLSFSILKIPKPA